MLKLLRAKTYESYHEIMGLSNIILIGKRTSISEKQFGFMQGQSYKGHSTYLGWRNRGGFCLIIWVE